MLQEIVKQEPEDPSLDSLSKVVTSAKAPIRATAVQKRELLQFFDGGHYRNLEEIQEASERIGLSVLWIQSWMTRTRVSKGLARSRKANGKQDVPKEVIKIEDDEPVSPVLLQGSISQGPPTKRRRKRVVSSYHVATDIVDIDEPPSTPTAKTAPPQVRLTIRLPARPAAHVKSSQAVTPQPSAASLPQFISPPVYVPVNASLSSTDFPSLPIPPPPLTVIPPPARQSVSQVRANNQSSISGRTSAILSVTSSVPAAKSAPTIRIPASTSLSHSNLAKTPASISAHARTNTMSTSASPAGPSNAVARSTSNVSSSQELRQSASSRNPEYMTSRCRVIKRPRIADPIISSRRPHPGLLTDTDTLTIYTSVILPTPSKRRSQPQKSEGSLIKSKPSKRKAAEQEVTAGHDSHSGSASIDASPNDSDSSSESSSLDFDDASVLDGIPNRSTAPPEPSHPNGAAVGLPTQPVPANAPPCQALPPPIRPLSATNSTSDPKDDRQSHPTPPPPPLKTTRPRASLNVTFSETPTIMPNRISELQHATSTPSLSQPTFATLVNVPAERIYPLTAVPHADDPLPLLAPPPLSSEQPTAPPIEAAPTPLYQGVHTFMFDPDLPAKTQEELNASIRVTKRQPDNDFARLLKAKIDPYDMNRTSFRRVSLPSSVSSRGLS